MDTKTLFAAIAHVKTLVAPTDAAAPTTTDTTATTATSTTAGLGGSLPWMTLDDLERSFWSAVPAPESRAIAAAAIDAARDRALEHARAYERANDLADAQFDAYYDALPHRTASALPPAIAVVESAPLPRVATPTGVAAFAMPPPPPPPPPRTAAGPTRFALRKRKADTPASVSALAPADDDPTAATDSDADQPVNAATATAAAATTAAIAGAAASESAKRHKSDAPPPPPLPAPAMPLATPSDVAASASDGGSGSDLLGAAKRLVPALREFVESQNSVSMSQVSSSQSLSSHGCMSDAAAVLRDIPRADHFAAVVALWQLTSPSAFPEDAVLPLCRAVFTEELSRSRALLFVEAVLLPRTRGITGKGGGRVPRVWLNAVSAGAKLHAAALVDALLIPLACDAGLTTAAADFVVAVCKENALHKAHTTALVAELVRRSALRVSATPKSAAVATSGAAAEVTAVWTEAAASLMAGLLGLRPALTPSTASALVAVLEQCVQSRDRAIVRSGKFASLLLEVVRGFAADVRSHKSTLQTIAAALSAAGLPAKIAASTIAQL